MAKVELIMPQMGESVMEAKIIAWMKKPGDKVEKDESILEVATDKVDTEVPSMYAGTVVEILAQVDEVVAIGKPIAVLETEDDVSSSKKEIPTTPTTSKKENTKESQEKEPTSKKEAIQELQEKTPTEQAAISDIFFSPLVKTIATKENIPFNELEKIKGTGLGGRITKQDVLSYLEKRQPSTTPSTASSSKSSASSTPVFSSGEDEIIEMDRMRLMIAERMVESWHVSPHVTSFIEVDVTDIVLWRNKWRKKYTEDTGDVLTLTPIFIEGVVKALRDYPMVNAQISGTKIIVKKEINIGVAVALPNGNLIVPVIKKADTLSIKGIVHKLNTLAKQARNNKLKPDDLAGGTYTVSNLGSFGNVMGTPIIVQPQVGIMAFGFVNKKPAVIETPMGDSIGIRHKMFLSHSYDHRIIDGALGGSMLRRVKEYLEKFDTTQSL